MRGEGRAKAEGALRRFRVRWRDRYPAVVKLGQDLPELLAFFASRGG